MSLSGTLYSDEGVTALTGSTKTIRIAVGTTTVSVHSTTTVSASGTWTFDLGASASLATSTPILVWVDGDATTRAALLTKASSTQSITGLNLYQNRVIVRHEATSATSTTLTDLAFYDADDDSDIQYTSNSGALTVFAGQELHVWPGKSFTASGTVEVRGNAGSGTDGSLHLPGTASFTMVGTTTLAGNFTASSSATFSNATATLLMNATTTGKTLSVPATTLGAVRFNGSGGGWTFGTTSTTTDLTISAGTVVAPATTLAITGDYTNSGTFTHNSGTVYAGSLTTAQTFSGTMTGSSAFNNVIVAGTSTQPTDSDLVGYWSFDSADISGTTAYDRSGGGNNGTLTNGPVPTTGKVKEGLNFDGTADYVTMGSPASLDDIVALTSCAWIYPETLPGSGASTIITEKTSGTGGWAFGVMNSGGTLVYGLYRYFSTYDGYWFADQTIPLNTWTHVCFTYDNSSVSNDPVFYLNGVPAGTTEYYTPIGTVDSDAAAALAVGAYPGANYFDGTIDEVRIYDRLLSGADVDMLYDAASKEKKTFSGNASTTNLTVTSGEFIAPASLSVEGDYTNNGTFTAGAGTMYFSGVGAQVATGTLSATSSLYNVGITNTATTTFGAPLTVTGTFTDTTPGSALVFTQSATSTFATTTITGTSGSEVRIRSLSAGTQFGFDVNGTYSLTYLDVKDSHACGANAGGDLTATSSIDSGNNTCWSFGGSPGTPLTLSGTLYADEGATQITSGKTIKAAIGTSTVSVHSTTTNAGTGAFSLTIPAGHTISASTPILVWVDGDATTRAVTYTHASSTNALISGVDLYQNRVIVRHEATSATSTTLTDLAFYDADDDSDIQYTSNSGALTVFAGQELHVWSGKTFTASGTVEVRGNAGSGTDGSLHLPGTASFTMVGTTTLAGNFTASSSATFSNATATLLMNATTTGKTLSVPATTLGAVRFNGSGGGWTFGTTSTTTDLTISAGTVTAPATTLAITGDYTNNGTFTHNNGTVYVDGSTTAQTFSGTMTGSSAFNNVIVAGTSTQAVSNEGLIGHWMFNENTGTTVEDSSGAGSDGTLTNGPTWIDGHAGTAVNFDGSNDYVTMGSGAEYDNIGPVTVSMWIKPDSVVAASRPFIGKSSDGSAYGWTVGQSSIAPGKLYIQVIFSSNDMVLRSNNSVFSAGEWQHVTFTFDGTTSYANQHIYVNGTEVGYDTANSSDGIGTIDDSAYDLVLGRDGTGGPYMYAGGMDEVRLYNRALSAAEVQSNYANSATSKTFAQNASTTNLTINSGEFVAPTSLSIAGNYTNNGTFTARTGTTTLSGTSAQTLSGTMTGSSAFGNLVITNTSGGGDATQSVTFANVASTTDTLTMRPGTSAKFPASATSTFQNVSLAGSSGQYVWLRSSSAGTRYAFYVPGTQKSVTYVNVKDSSACPTTMLATDGTSIDGGNNLCWSFPTAATISSASNQAFTYGQATTTMSTITITDGVTPTITATNDIRIVIATSTTNMRFDTTDTTATFGGTASAKVANPVSYLGDGAVLVIPVSSDFSASDTLTISDLSFARFEGVNAAASALGVRVAGVGTTTSAVDDKTVTISGTLVASEHTAGQVGDSFNTSTETDEVFFIFALATVAEDATISSFVIRANGDGVRSSDMSNVKLYRDNDADGVVSGGDTQVGGSGSVTLATSGGTITFTTPFTASTTQKQYILTGTVTDITAGDILELALSASDSTATGGTSAGAMARQGTLATIRHIRGGGGGSISSLIGGPAPAGDGIVTGGGAGGGDAVDPDSGDTIGHEVGFNAPSAHGSPLGAWTTGANAYASDGMYMTTSSNGAQHSLGSFNFSVPEGNEITGIEVKIEASGSTAAGTISGRLSWNGGGSVTSLTTTGTLGLTDAVYTLGSPSNTWGHSWTASEFTNGNFTLELVANTSANTLRVDAIQVKVYHQSTGGSQGGGGGPIIYQGNSHLFASAYGALGESVGTAFSTFIRWLARS